MSRPSRSAPDSAAARRNRKRELPKTLTAEEVELLRAAPNLDTPTGLRDRCMIELMLTCGLRVTETTLLQLRDVDWKAGEIRLRAEITKGNKEAVVYLTEPTQTLLERWKAVRRQFGAGKQHLFVSIRTGQRGDPVTRRRVEAMVDRRGRKSIGRSVHPHQLRHTFATRMLAQPDVSIRDVQQLMRHSDLRTTMIYLHVRNEDLKAKVRAAGAAEADSTDSRKTRARGAC